MSQTVCQIDRVDEDTAIFSDQYLASPVDLTITNGRIVFQRAD